MAGLGQLVIGFALVVAGALILGGHNLSSLATACGLIILSTGIVICCRAPKE